MYDYSYYGTEAISDVEAMESVAAAAGGVAMFTWVITLAISVLLIVSYWKMFKKAGQPGWAAIIPIYNMVVMFRVAKMNPLLLLLYIVPIVNFVAIPVLGIMLCVKTAKAFGKGAGYAIGLLFLPMIFYPMIAFGSAEYEA